MHSKQFALAALAAILVSPASHAWNPVRDFMRASTKVLAAIQREGCYDCFPTRDIAREAMRKAFEAARQVEASTPIETATESAPVEDVSPDDSESSLSE